MICSATVGAWTPKAFVTVTFRSPRESIAEVGSVLRNGDIVDTFS
jgi:hypothetical protein